MSQWLKKTLSATVTEIMETMNYVTIEAHSFVELLDEKSLKILEKMKTAKGTKFIF